MIFIKTKLKGAYIISVERREDERGFFGRIYCQQEFEKQGIDFNIVQSNISYNKNRATLRGMHMQLAPYKEAKLVSCVRGGIYDVIIDMRKNSPTFCQWIGIELNEDDSQMLYIPEGFAHGFITLRDNTEVIYQISEFYTPGSEKGIRWNDPFFNIQWPIEPQIISEKDQKHPSFQQNWLTSTAY